MKAKVWMPQHDGGDQVAEPLGPQPQPSGWARNDLSEQEKKKERKKRKEKKLLEGIQEGLSPR